MGRIATRHYNDASLNAVKLTTNLRTGRWARIRFDHVPSVNAGNGFGDPTGATGDVNSAYLEGVPQGVYADYHIKGAGQTILAPVMAALGLDISLDQTNDEGVEWMFGGNSALSPFAFVVGTDLAFYLKVNMNIDDVSGTDDCAVGFRKVEAAQANLDDYDEMAVLNVISGDIKAETILNAGATVTTDTTLNWADTNTKTLEIRIRGRRAEFFVDSVPATGLPVFDFDTGEVVMPFIFFLHAADVTPLVLISAEMGLLSEVNSNGVAS